MNANYSSDRRVIRNEFKDKWRSVILNRGHSWLNRLYRALRPPRLHGFEFCDQHWVRGFWRETYMEGLNLLCRLGRLDRRVAPAFLKWSAASGDGAILELASGNGEVAASIIEAALRNGDPVPHIILSDLYPDVERFMEIQKRYPQYISYLSHAVDATALDPSFLPARRLSLCAGFHHFRPGQAAQVIRLAARHMDGVFIGEYFPRKWRALMTPLCSLFPLLFLALLDGRFTWKKFVVTTLIPIIPLMITWDGLMSVMRVYRPVELEAMVPEECRDDWRWEQDGSPYWFVFRSLFFLGTRIKGRVDVANKFVTPGKGSDVAKDIPGIKRIAPALVGDG